MKKVIKILFVAYFSAILMVGTIGLPVFIHQCTITLQKDIHLTHNADEEHCDMAKACHKSDNDEEDDCCAEQQLFVHVDLQSFPQVELAKSFVVKSILAESIAIEDVGSADIVQAKDYYPPLVYETGKDIRTALQSFLC